MGIFQSFREPGWNTYYSDQLNFGSSVDLTMAVIIYLIVVMFAAMAMVVIGTRGNEVSGSSFDYTDGFLPPLPEVWNDSTPNVTLIFSFPWHDCFQELRDSH